jgi:penicillin-binding protein 2
MGERLGLGTVRPNIGLGDEKNGVIPTKAWRQAVRHTSMTEGETVNMGIGQGDVLVTPLQLATMVARIANGSKAVTPYLVRSIGGIPVKPPEPEDLGIAGASIQLVQAGAYAVVNEPGGTGYPVKGVRFDMAGMKMCGKSGTSQVFHRSHGDKRKTSELPWHLRNHALFVGWAPYDAPRYATIVVIEHGEAGGRVAGPVVSDIIQQVLLRDPARMTAYEPKKADPING